MATTQDLVYRVAVNDAQLDRLIQKVATLNATLYSSQAALKPIDAQLRGFGRRTVEIGRYLTRNVTAPLALIGGLAVKMAYDFDKSLSRIQTLAGASAEELAAMRKEVLALARTSPTSATELADALYFIRSSGFDAAESLKVLEASNKAAVAGLGDVKSVADAVTSAMNAYGHGVYTAERATDIFLATVRVGKAEPGELARSIGRVIPIANQMGVALEEVGGAIADLTLQGLSTDLAVTGLRATLTTFTKILKPTAQALEAIGLSGEQVQKSIGEQGLQATLQDLRRRVDQFATTGGTVANVTMERLRASGEAGAKAISQLEKAVGTTSASLLAKMFPNVKALNSFLVLTARNGKVAANVLGQVSDSVGETEVDYAAALQKNWAKLGTTLNRIKTEMIEIGAKIMPFATAFLGIAAAILGAFNSLPGPLKEVIGLFVVMAAVFGPLLVAIGMATRLLSVFAIQTTRSAATTVAAKARETEAVYLTGIAADKAAAAAILAEAQKQAAINGTTVAYERQRIASVTATPFGPRGPGGRFVSKDEAERLKRASREFSRWGRFLNRAGVAAGALGGALGGIMGFVWPVALTVGVTELITHWDDLGNKMRDVFGMWDKFNQKTKGGFVNQFAKWWEGSVSTNLEKSGLPKWAQTLVKIPTLGILGAMASDAKRAKKSQDEHAESVRKTTQYAVELAKMLGISADEAARLLTAGAATKTQMEKVAAAMKDAFGTLMDDAMSAFDAATERMVTNLKVQVTALGRTFKVGQDTLTPAERELKALDKVQEKRGLMEALSDAKERLREARGKKLVEVQRGGYIYGFVSRGDTKAIKDASKSVRNAQEDLQRYGLTQRAEVERKAADLALREAEKQLRSRRDLEQRHFKKQLENLETALATGQITMDEAHRRIKALLDKYGVEGEIAGKDLGEGFARGLRESMKLVMVEYKKIRKVWLAIIHARDAIVAPAANTAAAASASIEASRTAGAGQFPYYGVSTTPAGLVTPPGSAVTIQNMWVTSPAMAELVASTIARKVTRR